MFTSSTTWTPPTHVSKIRVLAVGGGGGGGGGSSQYLNAGGGGGGGGVTDQLNVSISSALVEVTVGAGGDGAPGTTGGGGWLTGGNGTASLIAQSGSIKVQADGGFGGTRGQYTTNGTGGSGGTSGAPASNVGGSGPYRAGGGGGGAYGAGSNGASNGSSGGAGGAGALSAITGSSLRYGGGGGGGAPESNGGSGGLGGGGKGGDASAPIAGTDGLGGGGGGAGNDTSTFNGAKGGSGVVIIRYLLPTVPPAVSNLAISQRLADTDTDPDTVTLSWSAVSHTTPVTRYEVEYSKTADYVTSTIATAASTSTTVSTLEDGMTYFFRVRAVNVVGPGPWSRSISSKALSTEDSYLSLPDTTDLNDPNWRDGLTSGTSRVDGTTGIAAGGVIPSSTSFTAEAWVYPESLNNQNVWHQIFQQSGSSSSNYGRFGLNLKAPSNNSSAGYAGVQVIADGVNTESSPQFLIARVYEGRWTHIAVSVEVVSSSLIKVKVYLDGVLAIDHSGDPDGTFDVRTDDFTVGYFLLNNTDRHFHGGIDQVKIWDGVLSETQVVQSMHSWGAEGVTSAPALRAHIDFNGDYTDVTGNFDLSTEGNVSRSDLAQTSQSGLRTVVTFPRSYLSASGGWSTPDGISTVDYLVVGGGGGGGAGYPSNHGGGGGGAGAFKTGSLQPPASHLPVKVGAGGSAGIVSGAAAGNGQSSQLASVEALGGGAGGSSYTHSASSGASGGGGAASDNAAHRSGATGSDGFPGGSVNLAATAGRHGAGGGGAGGAGGNTTTNTSNSLITGSAGAGGAGLTSSITGSPLFYAGGGGGGGNTVDVGSSGGALGGSGVGGTGATYTTNGTISATPGAANRGGGGGGGIGSGGATAVGGAAGGSGVVIIRYSQDRTLTLDNAGATSSQVVPAGTTPTVAVPTRLGYTFKGWSAAQDNTAEYNTTLSNFSMPDEDTTLYAIWESQLVLAFDSTDTNSYSSGSTFANLGRTGSSNDATIVGAGIQSPTAQAQYFDFPGGEQTTSYFDLGGTLSSNLFQSGYTVDFFASIPAFVSGDTLPWERIVEFSKDDGTGSPYDNGQQLTVSRKSSTNQLTLHVWNNTANVFAWCETQGDVPTGVMKRFTLVGDSTGCEIYVDGVPQNVVYANSDRDFIPPTGTVWDTLHIGRAAVGDYGYFSGEIRSLRVFSGVLDAAQIDQIDSGDLAYKTVTLDQRDDPSSPTTSTLVTSGTLALPNPQRAGYNFTGWSTSQVGPATITSISPTQDVTVYAQWSANTNNVTWDSNGGSTIASSSFATGGTITKPSNPTLSGKVFVGWSTTDNGTNGDYANRITTWPYATDATADTTLHAIWYEPCTVSSSSFDVGATKYTSFAVTSGSDCAIEVPAAVSTVDTLLVGGGGGGGENVGAGGAGGGVFFKAGVSLGDADGIVVSVGSGGRAGKSQQGVNVADPLRDGGAGGNSTIDIGSLNLFANGGAGGQTHWKDNTCGDPDASGFENGANTLGGTISSGQDAGGQGANGGEAAAGSSQAGYAGGVGYSINFFGSSVVYGSGGGGGAWGAAAGGAGGDGAGSGGSFAGGTVGSAGLANRGGGGGGGNATCASGGAGGSGLVAIRFASPTFTVTYDANGATGGTAPDDQTKTYGVSLHLAANSGSLVKSGGYIFAGWNTQADGLGQDYAELASYNIDAPLELFAKWTTVDPPGAPSGLVLTSGDTSVTLSWTAPASAVQPASDYKIEYQLRGDSSWTTFADGTSTLTSATVTGLTTGKIYNFRVSAINEGGTGLPSDVRTTITLAGMISLLDASDSNSYSGSGSTWFDLTGNDNSVTAVGSPTFNSSGGYFDLNGTSQYFTYGTSTDAVQKLYFAGTSPYTIVAFVSPDNLESDPNREVLFARWNGSVGGSYMLEVNDQGFNAQREVAPWRSAQFGSVVNGGKSFAIHSYDGTNASVFVDGEFAGAQAFGSITNRPSVESMWGARKNANVPMSHFDGKFFAAAIFSESITPEQALALTQAFDTAPLAPSIDSISVSSGNLSVQFTAGENNGTAIKTYQYSTDGGSTWRNVDGGGTSSPLVITTTSASNSPLVNGTSYDIQIRALNTLIGAASATASATPLAAGLIATFDIPTQTADGFTVSISNYDASFTWNVSASVGSVTLNSSTGVVTVSGLTAGQQATITVTTAKQGFATESNTVTGASISNFTLSLVSEGVTTTQSVVFGQAPTDPSSTIVRAGYTLSGWSDADDQTAEYSSDLSDFTMPAADDTLWAVWTAGTNSITWDSNGGSAISSPATFVTGGQIAKPASPARSGFTFGGWSTSETDNNGDLGNRIASWPYSSPATSDIVLYAIWLDEMFLYEPLSNVNGSTLDGIATPGVSGLTGNWSKVNGVGSAGAAGSVLLAPDSEPTFPTNSSFSLPASNSLARDISNLWNIDYSARELTTPISFDEDGVHYLSFLAKTGANDMAMAGLLSGLPASTGDTSPWNLMVGAMFDKTLTIDYGNANEAAYKNQGYNDDEVDPTKAKDNYSAQSATNQGFNLGYRLVVAKITTTANGNDTVEAVSFGTTDIIPADVANLGSWDVSYSRAITGDATLLAIQLEHYAYLDEIRMGSTWTSVTGALGTYTISYDSNGATAGSAPSSQQKIAGSDIALATNSGSLERTGYSFAGWNSAADGGGTDYAPGENYTVDASLPLFAKWQPNTYTITYNLGSFGSGANQTATKTHDLDLTLPDANQANAWFARAGYTVSGWATTDGGPLAYDLGATYTLEGDATLYPVWSTATYVVPATGDTFVNSGSSAGRNFGDSSGLLFKNASISTSNSYNRVAYAEFTYDPDFLWFGAALEVYVSGNQDGTRNNGYNITYTTFNVDVYGASDASWDESTLTFSIANASSQGWGLNTSVFPWNPDNAVYLGTISVPTNPNTVGQKFALATEELDNFLNGDADGNVTIFMRRSDIDNQSNLSFASKEHPTLTGPTLTVADVGYSYTIAYDINGGTGSIPAPGTFVQGGTPYTVLAGTNVRPPASKTFAGWNTKADGSGTDYAPGDTYSANRSVTLYAKFADFPRAVFKSNYAAGPQDLSQIMTPSTATNLRLNSFSRIGYSFAGWDTLAGGGGTAYDDGDSVSITTDLELFAQWTPNTYQILYQYNGADGSNGTTSDSYQTEDPALVLPTPTRTGYTFGGWYSSITLSGSALGSSIQPTANSTLYAKWNAINYSVSYLTTDSNAGTAPSDSSHYTYQQSLTIRANTGNLERYGYNFAGWVLDPNDPAEVPKNAGQTITFGAADITLHPKWEPETYTITYHSNGATSGSPDAPSEPYTTGQGLLSLPGAGTLDKPGYTFGGWATTPSNGSPLPGIVNPNDDVDLYAIWNVTDYYFVYDLNGGTGSGVATQTGDVERSLTISSEGDAQYSGKWFAGWNTEPDGSGDSYAPGTSVRTPIGGLNLYAVWVPNTYKIYYNANGGNGGPNLLNGFDSATDGQPYNILDKGDLSRPGYNFSHWSKVSTGAGEKYDHNPNGVDEVTSFIASGNSTLFAQWTPINYTLFFDVVGGSASIGPQGRTIGQNYTMPSAGTKNGYTFLHWSDGSVNYPAGSTFTVGTASKVFTAVWRPNTYTITYDWQGGSTTGSAQVSAPYTVGTGAMNLPDGTGYERDGFDFLGWAETPGGNQVSGYQPSSSRVLYALWQSGNFNLTFDVNTQGQPAGSVAVPRATSTVLPLPVREGFVFTGWFDADVNGVFVGTHGDDYTPTASGTLHAGWVQKSLFGVDLAELESGGVFTVGSAGNGGSISVNHPPTNTSASVSIPNSALPAGTVISARYFREIDRQADIIPGDNNYIFSLLVSWILGSDDAATVPITAPDKPIEVTMNSDAIKAGQMIFQLIGDQYTELGRATQDGTLTVYLTEDPEIVVAATTPDTPTIDSVDVGMNSATVSWTEPINGGSPITSYTVTSTPGGFSCVTVDLSCTITGLADGVDYTFAVTASNSVGDSALSASSTPVAPTPTVYTVTYDSNGGSTVADGSFQLGGTVSPPISPTRSGYTFVGWTTTLDDESTLVSFPYDPGVDSNITLYGFWRVNPPAAVTQPGPAAGIEAVSGQTRAWTKRISATEVKVYIKFPEMGANYQIRLQKDDGEYVRLMSKTVNSTASDSLLIARGWYYLVRTIELPGDGRYRIEVTQDGQRMTLNGNDRPAVYSVIKNAL